MKIILESLPIESARYNTVGDWTIDETGTIRISVHLPSGDGAFLCALHELVEVWLCQKRGITQKQVDEFDFAWNEPGEPGDDPTSPYKKEHRFAMLIEHLVAHELGLTGYGEVR